MKAYLHRNGLVEGPYSLDELAERLAAGELAESTEICPEGGETWIPLAAALARPRPPRAARQTPATPPPLRPRQRSGCRKGCGFLLVAFVVLCVALGITLHRIVWHSAIPYKLIASLVCKSNPNIEVEGIRGSISEGISIRQFRYTDEDGNTSFLEDAGFRHNPLRQIFSRKRFILYSVKAKRGHFFVSSFRDTGESTDTDDADDPEDPISAVRDSNQMEGLKLFEIRDISIEDITLQARDTGRKFVLARFHLDGLKIEDGHFDMGQLLVRSNLLDLEIPPVSSAFANGRPERLELAFNGTLKPDLIGSMAEPVAFGGAFAMVDDKRATGSLTACDGAVTATMRTDAGQTAEVVVKAADLRIRTYVPTLMLDHVSGTLRLETLRRAPVPSTPAPRPKERDRGDDQAGSQQPFRLILTDGSFQFGTATFTCDALDRVIDQHPGEPIQVNARAVKDGISYLLTVTIATGDDPPAPQLALTSSPDSNLRDMLGNLLFSAPYAELSAEKRQSVDWHENLFTRRLPGTPPATPHGSN